MASVNEQPVKADREVFFGLLRCVLGDAREIESERWEISPRLACALMELGGRHDLAHLTAAAIQKIAPQLSGQVEQAIYTAVYRDGQREYALGELEGILNRAGIDYIPLKGAVIRELYPESWMRTSCDIDILVHEDDALSAVAALEAAGYIRLADTSTHDYSLSAPSGVHIELHYTLSQDGAVKSADPVLGRVWDTSRALKGRRRELSGETVIFYHLAHMAKHLIRGGCGVRPFVDLWLMENKLSFDRGRLEEMLGEGELGEFYAEALRLSRVWMENIPHTRTSSMLEEYVLCGGAYGTASNAAKTQAAGGGSRLAYFWRLMFLPCESLQVIYPSLKNHPALAPLYQVRRWLRVLRRDKRQRLRALTQARSSVTPQQSQTAAELMNALGLTDK